MKRLAVVLLFSLLTLLVAAPSALAAPPTHERVPVDDVVVDEESCGFPVEVHTTGFILAIEWVAEEGSLRRFEAYPQFKATLTNLVTGESIRVNIAGPAHITESRTGASPWSARVTGCSVPIPIPMS